MNFFQTQFQQKMRLMTLIWLALMASTGVLGFLVSRIPVPPDAPPLLDVFQNNSLVQTMAVVAVLAVVASKALPAKLFLNRARMKELRARPWTAEALASEKVEGRPVYRAEDIPKLLQFTDKERALYLGQQAFIVPTILGCALSESSALLGFQTATQLHDPRIFVPFAALAFVGFLLARPSEDKISEFVS